MKALIEKKVIIEPYSPSEGLDGKMVKKTVTIYFLCLPVFQSISNLENLGIDDRFCNGTPETLLKSNS